MEYWLELWSAMKSRSRTSKQNKQSKPYIQVVLLKRKHVNYTDGSKIQLALLHPTSMEFGRSFILSQANENLSSDSLWQTLYCNMVIGADYVSLLWQLTSNLMTEWSILKYLKVNCCKTSTNQLHCSYIVQKQVTGAAWVRKRHHSPRYKTLCRQHDFVAVIFRLSIVTKLTRTCRQHFVSVMLWAMSF